MANPEEHSFPQLEIQPFSLLMGSYRMLGSQFWLFVGITAVGWIVAGAVPIVLVGPMMCGMFMCYLKHMRAERVPFETLFKGFDHFVESLIATAVITGITLGIALPLGLMVAMVAFVTRDHFLISLGFGVAGLLWLILGMVVTALTLFVHPLIVDRQLKAIPALKLSIAAVRSNLLQVLLLVFVMGLALAISAVFCYLPVFLMFPITLGAIATLYREFFPDEGTLFD